MQWQFCSPGMREETDELCGRENLSHLCTNWVTTKWRQDDPNLETSKRQRGNCQEHPNCLAYLSRLCRPAVSAGRAEAPWVPPTRHPQGLQRRGHRIHGQDAKTRGSRLWAFRVHAEFTHSSSSWAALWAKCCPAAALLPQARVLTGGASRAHRVSLRVHREPRQGTHGWAWGEQSPERGMGGVGEVAWVNLPGRGRHMRGWQERPGGPWGRQRARARGEGARSCRISRPPEKPLSTLRMYPWHVGASRFTGVEVLPRVTGGYQGHQEPDGWEGKWGPGHRQGWRAAVPAGQGLHRWGVGVWHGQPAQRD